MAAEVTPMTTASDIRPSQADLDALLASTSLTAVTRRAVIDALENADLLWGSKPPLAADSQGRLLASEVNCALEKFDESIRTQVMAVLASVSALA